MRLSTVSIVVVAGLVTLQPWLAPAAMAQTRPYSRLVVFGDSLTDPGNAFVLTGEVATPPFAPIPSAPYARGGLHFSNGATWVEQLAGALRVANSAGPALRVPGVFSNYAVGAARARLASPFNLGDQVQRFLNDFGGVAPADALYVVHIGSNDVRDALVALGADPTFGTSLGILSAALTAMQANIVALAQAGAQTFLVPNVPDLALLPALGGQSLEVRMAATALSTVFNDSLESLLSGLDAHFAISIIRLDVFTIISEIVQDPAAAGFANAIAPCINFGVQQQPFCTQPDRHLFWDAIHPTRAGHRVLAQAAYALVTTP